MIDIVNHKSFICTDKQSCSGTSQSHSLIRYKIVLCLHRRTDRCVQLYFQCCFTPTSTKDQKPPNFKLIPTDKQTSVVTHTSSAALLQQTFKQMFASSVLHSSENKSLADRLN